MALQNVIELGVGSVSACIKVDDAFPELKKGAMRECGALG